MLASCQAQPSERVTEMLDRDDNGSDAGVRGRANKLPVICLPGFCSSGLEVRRSAVMPSWIGDRVWFNLKKIMRARTQRSGAAAQGPAQTFTVTVHRAENLVLSLEKDRETIDGLVVKLQLLTKKGDILAEKQTDAIRLSEGVGWSGTAEYQQEVTLSSESLKPAVALRVLLVDEDAVGFDDSEDQKDAPEHVGTASIQLSTFLPHKVASFELRGAGPAGSAGAVVLTSQGDVVRNRV
eukprot:COSAG04_NODE_9422_length_866_cov_0.637549_1_plen_237_part_10